MVSFTSSFKARDYGVDIMVSKKKFKLKGGNGGFHHLKSVRVMVGYVIYIFIEIRTSILFYNM
jgi:hypothetical protein